jgi:hypothetical protein
MMGWIQRREGIAEEGIYEDILIFVDFQTNKREECLASFSELV